MKKLARRCLRLGIASLGALLLAFSWPGAAPALAQSITFSPASGAPFSSVTVSGSGFTDGDTYQITFAPGTIYEQLLAPTTVISGSSFSRAVTVPSAPWGQYNIVVATNRGNFSRSFRVVSQIQLASSSGYVADTVTVTGQGFQANTSVSVVFNRSVIVEAETDIYGNLETTDFEVPTLPRGDYNVYGTDGTAISPTVVFTIQSRLSINPPGGPVGTRVQLTGTGFGGGYIVVIYWDDQLITSNIFATSTGSFSTTIEVPASIHGTHTISARDSGLGTGAANFVVSPAITLAPASGSPGTLVAVTGTGFRRNATVKITYAGTGVATQPSTITTDPNGGFSASFTVPSGVSGTYAINASDGIYSAAATFGVAANVSISPASGHVGSELMVNGTGFTPGGRVAVSYDAQAVITVTTDSLGAFSVSFNVPASPAGQHDVSARDLSTPGVTASATFTMESTPPPTPGLLTPQYTSLTGTQPLFTWSPVTDPSGVTYDFQIARNAGFSQLVIFKQGLAQPQYQVSQSEALPLTKKDSPFYWRVRAVDGAGNAGNWTSAGSFYTQDSTPPAVPALLSPAGDSQASLQPGFTWSPVTDPSGVTYDIQVARDAAFAQLVIFKQGLTQTVYQVPASEALQMTKRTAPYYWRVRATDGAANTSDWTAAGSFYTEDSTPPPVPAPLSPENGSRTAADVSFDWTDVSDPSGVTYTLEAAQDADFAHLVVYKDGLKTSEYQLTKTEGLTASTGSPASPYYWRVRAVDGAQNASDWSTVSSFYVSGFGLRGWLLVVVLVIGAALLLAAGVYIGMKIRPGPPEEEDL
jgi:hypothetical protein